MFVKSQFLLVTGRNEVVAKVMFLQVCVCPQGGGCLPQCMLGCHPPGTRQTPPGPGRPPGTRQTPWDLADPPRPGRPPPPGSRLQHTVYERPVRILLECILVFSVFPLHLSGLGKRAVTYPGTLLIENIHYKITRLKSYTSTLWKLWRGHNEYYNVHGVLLWQMATLFLQQ